MHALVLIVNFTKQGLKPTRKTLITRIKLIKQADAFVRLDMSKSYAKSKGRRTSDGGFFAFPKTVLRHPNFIQLSPHAVKLLVDLGEQFWGKNNGDMCATWAFMRDRGWRSQETLNIKLKELRYYGMIVVTQIGGLNRPTLYAFSWLKIDKAKADSGFRVGDIPGLLKETKPKFKNPISAKRKERKKSKCGNRSRALRLA